MKLKARQVDATKPREKAYKLLDGAVCIFRLFPLVPETGA